MTHTASPVRKLMRIASAAMAGVNAWRVILVLLLACIAVLALMGHNAVMPAVERISDVPYKYRIGVAPLSKVANVEKFMPRDFITKDGFGITDKCKRYLTPLIQGEDHPKYKNGLPVYVTLKNLSVAQKLPKFKL